VSSAARAVTGVFSADEGVLFREDAGELDDAVRMGVAGRVEAVGAGGELVGCERCGEAVDEAGMVCMMGITPVCETRAPSMASWSSSMISPSIGDGAVGGGDGDDLTWL
jgi:hypothetical protein